MAEMNAAVRIGDDDRSTVWASSLPIGEPQITQIGFSVVSAAATRSRANGIDIDSRAPVIGTLTQPLFGSAMIVSRIFAPRQSDVGAPPLSTGFDTRR